MNHSPTASLLSRGIRNWDWFWFRPSDPTTLGLIRILVGLMTLYVHIGYSWGLLGYVGPESWFDDSVATFVRLEQPYYAPGANWNDPYQEVSRGNNYWSVFFHVRDARWIVALHGLFLTAMLLFTLGLWTRAAAIVSWLGAMSYVQRASNTVFGMDTMMMVLLFYLMLSPCGATFSLDRLLACRRARQRGLPEPEVEPSVAANFVTRLTQVHLSIIYLAGGTSKLLGGTWWNATALNLVLLNYSFAPLNVPLYRSAITFLASHRWLWEIVTTAGVVYTLVLEIGFPFLVWNRHFRWVMVGGVILLHTGIGLFMGLVAFSLFMLVMALSFIPPDQVRSVLAVVARQIRQLGGSEEAPAKALTTKEDLVLSRS